MEKTIFDVYSKDEIEEKIKQIIGLIENGLKDEEIINKIDFELKEEFISIARARIKASKELGKYIGDINYFNLEDLRFGTPVNVANYRANRLKCKRMVDLCSGIGIQSNAFAKTCKEVYAFELDPKKVRYAEENFFNLRNIHFFAGDVLDKKIIEKIKGINPDIIFCDPERLVSEKERNIDTIKPDLKRLIEVYLKICPNLCLEVPPQIDINKLNELGESEKEYLSLNNKLNRLDLYFGELKEADVSVVDVNTGEIIEKENNIKKPRKSNRIFRYLYEASNAIEKAGVENELARELNAIIIKDSLKGKLLLTSDELATELNSFYKSYEIFYSTFKINDINRILKQKGFGKVLLKYSINPKDYWKERNDLERGLRGEEEAVIFNIFGKYVVCREMG